MYKTTWSQLALLQLCVFGLYVADSSDPGFYSESGSLGCNYHYLVPDDPPLTGIVTSYNYPFSYHDDLTCLYFIHLPLHLVNDGNRYQMCFKFHRFDLEDCFDKLQISKDTFCGKGRLDHNSPEVPTRSIWTEPLCYSLDKDGYTGGEDAYLKLTFDSDMRDVRRGFYAEFNVSIAQDAATAEPEQETTNTTQKTEGETGECHTDLNTFRCFDRSCTLLNATCDGVWNCPDHSDETYMHAGCNSTNEVPADEGWICDFESGEACGNFRASGWRYFSPKLHGSDDQYEPDKDHTHDSEEGYFITTDFASQTSGIATTKFPITLGDDYYCLSFWYQLRGQLVGRLDVHWGSATDGLPLWTRNGTTGYHWQRAQIPIYRPTIKKGEIVFKATRHSSARSKISIDDFALLRGQCQFQDDMSCNFETRNAGQLSGTCGWELYNDAYHWADGNDHWKIVQGNTIDDYSIYPDRSPENNVLKYTLNINKPAAAFIRSPVVSQGLKRPPRLNQQMRIYQSKCLTLWYYTTSDKLSIKYYANNGEGIPWSSIPFYTHHIREAETWKWKQMKVDLPNHNKPFRVILMVGYDSMLTEQTIAFDEFSLVGESCSYLETLLCPPGYFACKNGLCILERDRCNGYPDCKDHSDESKDWALCTYGESCKTSDFRCVTQQNVCLPRNWVCDGTQDCDDKSDERNCPSGHMVPPAAIGAICAAAVIVIGFILFKLAYGIWKKRQYDGEMSGGSAHELSNRELQVDPGAFDPPPTYAQCVSNPAYMPQDAFKPPEAPSGTVTAGGGQSTSVSSQPPPPTYDRILSGEFKELTRAEQRKVSRGESLLTEFSARDIPRELRPHRPRVNESGFDANHPDSTEQHNPHNDPSVFVTSSSQGAGHINTAFTDDEFSDILSAMQSADIAVDSRTDCQPDFADPQRLHHNGAYSNSGFQRNESLSSDQITTGCDPYENAIDRHNLPTDGTSNTPNHTFHISQTDDVNETSI